MDEGPSILRPIWGLIISMQSMPAVKCRMIRFSTNLTNQTSRLMINWNWRWLWWKTLWWKSCTKSASFAFIISFLIRKSTSITSIIVLVASEIGTIIPITKHIWLRWIASSCGCISYCDMLSWNFMHRSTCIASEQRREESSLIVIDPGLLRIVVLNTLYSPDRPFSVW